MAEAFKIEIVAGKDLADRFEHAGAETRGVIVKAVYQAEYLFLSAAKANLAGTHHRRSGGLANSLAAEPPVENGAEVIGRAGSNSIYARVQDQGGTIVAKNVAHLTIPLTAMLTGNGVARASARAVIESPSVYGFTRTFFAKGLLFGQRGEGGSAETVPLFALKRSVAIKPRPWMTPAFEETAPKLGPLISVGLRALIEESA